MSEAGDQSLLERVLRLEAVHAIAQIEGQYCRFWDAGEARSWSQLFVEGGIFEADVVDETPKSFSQGRDALEEKCAAASKRQRGLHIIGLPDIEVIDETAHARLHFLYRGMAQTERRLWLNYGLYDVRYIRLASGWFITHRIERAVSRDAQFAFDGFYGYSL